MGTINWVNISQNWLTKKYIDSRQTTRRLIQYKLLKSIAKY